MAEARAPRSWEQYVAQDTGKARSGFGEAKQRETPADRPGVAANDDRGDVRHDLTSERSLKPPRGMIRAVPDRQAWHTKQQALDAASRDARRRAARDIMARKAAERERHLERTR